MGQTFCYLEERVDVRKLGNNWIVECTDACSCDITVLENLVFKPIF